MGKTEQSLDNISFKKKHTFTKRLNEANRVLEKYTDRIPIIVERNRGNPKDMPVLDKQKFLVPTDLTVGQFVYVIRKRIKLSPEKAIFIMSKNKLPPTSTLISELYKQDKDEDNFLYLTYSSENTFG